MVAETTLQIESWPQTIDDFNRMVEATQDELVQFAFYRLGNQADAEDAVQDIYVQAFRDRIKRRHVTEVRPYLFRMVRNRCTDVLRARSRKSGQTAGDVIGTDDTLSAMVARDEARETTMTNTEATTTENTGSVAEQGAHVALGKANQKGPDPTVSVMPLR